MTQQTQTSTTTQTPAQEPVMTTWHVTAPEETFTIEKSGVYTCYIEEPHATVQIEGIWEAVGDEQIEVEVIIHHRAPHTRAETTLKGVGRDRSRISFTGRIIIDEDCGDSHSFLTERVLLLSEEASAEAVPDLEIMTDDVSCSHAASISNIDEEHRFYLMSRGIGRKQAERMIVRGFLESGF